MPPGIGLVGGAILGGAILAPAAGGVLAGAAGTVGTLGLAFAGIMPTLQAYSAAQTRGGGGDGENRRGGALQRQPDPLRPGGRIRSRNPGGA